MKRAVSSNDYNFFWILTLFMGFTFPKIISENGLNFSFKECFYTPGLFSREGFAFLRGFLFELPIAVLRWTSNTGMLPVILILAFLFVIDYFKKREGKNAKAQ